MTKAVLFILAGIFAYLAYDAKRLDSEGKDLEIGVDEQMRGRPLHERNRLKEWAKVHGFGNAAQVKWLFLLGALGCVLAAILGTP
ncbi:MAG TPA: hypothetical protein VEC35_09750 [Noviherbaspirillum sp.]|nr:hypothetical protein [Noviherbaspirillum sp.]